MADSDHLGILDQGVDAWNKWRKENLDIEPDLCKSDLTKKELPKIDFSWVNLREANLNNTCLIEADLSNANCKNTQFNKAKLNKANFSHARLYRASFRDADLSGADLCNANMVQANLSNTTMSGTKFKGVRIGGSYELRRANLKRANFKGLDLKDLDLREVDLSDVSGIELDSNDLRDTRFSPGSKGLWLTLRRKYTGSRFFFHLIMLVIFFLPYTARTFFWVGVSKGEEMVCERLVSLEHGLGGNLELVTTYPAVFDPNSPNVGVTASTEGMKYKLSEIMERVRANTKKLRVWKILLDIDKGCWYALTAVLLLVYNLSRFYLTRQVTVFSDEQNRTGFAPSLDAYRWLRVPHIIVCVLLWFAVALFVWHFYGWMTAEVYLPG